MRNSYCVQNEWFNKQFQSNWWFHLKSHFANIATAATTTTTIEENCNKILFYNQMLKCSSGFCLWLYNGVINIFLFAGFLFCAFCQQIIIEIVDSKNWKRMDGKKNRMNENWKKEQQQVDISMNHMSHMNSHRQHIKSFVNWIVLKNESMHIAHCASINYLFQTCAWNPMARRKE